MTRDDPMWDEHARIYGRLQREYRNAESGLSQLQAQLLSEQAEVEGAARRQALLDALGDTSFIADRYEVRVSRALGRGETVEQIAERLNIGVEVVDAIAERVA